MKILKDNVSKANENKLPTEKVFYRVQISSIEGDHDSDEYKNPVLHVVGSSSPAIYLLDF